MLSELQTFHIEFEMPLNFRSVECFIWFHILSFFFLQFFSTASFSPWKVTKIYKATFSVNIPQAYLHVCLYLN